MNRRPYCKYGCDEGYCRAAIEGATCPHDEEPYPETTTWGWVGIAAAGAVGGFFIYLGASWFLNELLPVWP